VRNARLESENSPFAAKQKVGWL